MSEEDGNIHKLIEYTNERLTDIQEDNKDLRKSYGVLNEHHHTLELNVNTLTTRLDTAIQILKFFISPGVAVLIIVDLLRMGGLIS